MHCYCLTSGINALFGTMLEETTWWAPWESKAGVLPVPKAPGKSGEYLDTYEGQTRLTASAFIAPTPGPPSAPGECALKSAVRGKRWECTLSHVPGESWETRCNLAHACDHAGLATTSSVSDTDAFSGMGKWTGLHSHHSRHQQSSTTASSDLNRTRRITCAHKQRAFAGFPVQS